MVDKEFSERAAFHAREAAKAIEEQDFRRAAYHFFQAAHCYAVAVDDEVVAFAAEKAAEMFRDIQDRF